MLGVRGWNPMGSLKVYKFGLWMRMRSPGDDRLESHLLVVDLEVGDAHQEVLVVPRLGHVPEDVRERVRDDSLTKSTIKLMINLEIKINSEIRINSEIMINNVIAINTNIIF